MRSRIGFIAARVATNLEQSGTPITLSWNIWPSDATRDPVTNAYTGTPTAGNETINALIHFVSASSVVRQFNEIEVGDAILDISPDVSLRGRDGLIYFLPTGPHGASEQWENKPMSAQLAAYWDTLQNGKRLFQTVLLKKSA